MSDSPVQLALREWRVHFSRPTTLVAIAGCGAILAVAAPFESGDVMRLVPRFAYWSVIVALSYSAGHLISDITQAVLKDWSRWVRVLTSGLLTGVAVCGIVFALNWAAFRFLPARSEIPEFIGPIFAISLIIAFVADILARGTAADKPQAPPPILERIAFDKRAALMALTVEDHYVRIVTAKGDELVLMRLSDAIREVGDTPGSQVHRSHWVAWDAVVTAKRVGDRAILTLKNGDEIPVSRANLAKVRDASFLAK